MSNQPWPVLPFSRQNIGAGRGVASDPVSVPEDHPSASPSLDALVGKVRSKEWGVNEFMVLLTEEACTATGATGAALALRSDNDGAIICRARCGETAPSLGSRLNTNSGISGECMRTGRLLCCDDTELDSRVDARACRELRVRSIVAVPLWAQNAATGILEVFSNSPRAFSDSDIENLKKLAGLATDAMRCSTDNSIALPTPVPWPEATGTVPSMIPAPTPKEELLPEPVSRRTETEWVRGSGKLLYWVIAGGVAVIVLLSLVVLTWEHSSKVHESSPPQQAEVQLDQTQSLNQAPFAPAASGENKRDLGTGGTSDRFDSNPPIRKHSSIANDDSRIDQQDAVRVRHFNAPKPAVSRNGSDIENDAPPPADALPPAKQSTFISSVLSIPASLPGVTPPRTSQGITPGRLEHKVEPIYPAQARAARVDGAVKLRATVGTDGKVRNVQIISGNPLLVHAAVDAVGQWRYKPYELNNQPVAMQTDIVIIFKLP
jgi:TonB family protein